VQRTSISSIVLVLVLVIKIDSFVSILAIFLAGMSIVIFIFFIAVIRSIIDVAADA
jgi:hypothetical protein